MNQHPTTMVDNFYLQMMATYTFLQGMVEWQEIHLENLEMLRTSRKFQNLEAINSTTKNESKIKVDCVPIHTLGQLYWAKYYALMWTTMKGGHCTGFLQITLL